MQRFSLMIAGLLFIAVSLSFGETNEALSVKRIDNLVAVFDLDVAPPVSAEIGRPLTDAIKREIVKSDKFEVMERSAMDKILKEQAFQMTGCVAKECAVAAGQMLGVGKVVVGSLSQVGRTYLLSLSLVNVETGKVERVEDQECKCEIDDLIKLSREVAQQLTGTSSASQMEREAITQQTTAKKLLEVSLDVDPCTGADWFNFFLYLDDRLIKEWQRHSRDGDSEVLYRDFVVQGRHDVRIEIEEPNSFYGPFKLGQATRSVNVNDDAHVNISANLSCWGIQNMHKAKFSIVVR